MNSVGIILTLLFTPEPLRVPLSELDRRYDYHRAGKVYHGVHLFYSSRLAILSRGMMETLHCCPR